MKLTAIKTSDPDWTRAGFPASSVVSLTDIDIVFEPAKSGGLVALGFDVLPHKGCTHMAGIPVFQWTKRPSPESVCPNTVICLDHVVIHIPEHAVTSFKQEMDSFGIPLRLTRGDIYPGVTQMFFRSGSTIEVIAMKSVTSIALWGLTLVARDLDAAKKLLGDTGASEPKKAVQPGRRIMTVRNMGLTNMAMMTPHVKRSSPL